MRRFAIAGVTFGVLLFVSAAVAIGSGWSIEHTPNPAGGAGPIGGSGIELSGVSCVSGRACTAVGFSAKGALVERWDGSEWSIERTPNTGKSSELRGVSCVSAGACTAVGSGRNGALVERWDGSRWSIEHTPSGGGLVSASGGLVSVSCVSASACIAVGYIRVINARLEVPLVERWNGTEWSIEHTPNGSVNLLGVSCMSASACIAVGDFGGFHGGAVGTLAERWDGSKWSIERTPNPIRRPGGIGGIALTGVSCVSASACTAVGDGGEVMLAERWNGARWSIQHTLIPTGRPIFVFDGVSCVSASDCTAVGAYFTRAGAQATLAERWNGSAWSIERTPNESSDLFGVSCVPARGCTAVGQHYLHGNTDGVTLAERERG